VGIRTFAVALLFVGVAGGYYVGEQRKAQQRDAAAQKAAEIDEAEAKLRRQRRDQYELATALKRVAEYQAAAKAAEEAKLAADRARKAESAAASRQAARTAAAASPKPYTGPVPTSCNTYSGSRQVGCAVLVASGLGIDQMPCLDKLWTKESGWNVSASNPLTGAYGIPQALPGSKMASVGPDWKNSAATQVKWGLTYIKDRYAMPCDAWAHSQNTGWY
jgi:hypothetical protein